jgi:ATP-dependent Clp protease ATP-binding subunit ClpA
MEMPGILRRFTSEGREERQREHNAALSFRTYMTEPEEVVEEHKKIRGCKVSEDMRAALVNFEDSALKHIFGQNQAVSTLSSAMMVAAAGLRPGNKLVGAYLFKGPTGVGKTALAELVSELLPETGFERIDMAEFQEEHTVSNMIGAPKSYVDSGEKGLLRELIDRHGKDRYLVILLDEIEKAHEKIFKLFLGAMDHAQVTDAHNKKIDFSKVILIMSSNAGEKEKARNRLGFDDGKPVKVKPALPASGEADDDSMNLNDKVLAQLFDPEFINRLDGSVTFGKLDDAAQMQVTGKFVGELKKMLAENPYGAIDMSITPEAERHIRGKGYNDRFGARPIRRWIERNISTPLSKEIMNPKGRLSSGGSVDIGVAETDGVRRLTFDFNRAMRETDSAKVVRLVQPDDKNQPPPPALAA